MSEVVGGWQCWVFMATIVLGNDSRWGHRVQLDSVPGLTNPPPKKVKNKLT